MLKRKMEDFRQKLNNMMLENQNKTELLKVSQEMDKVILEFMQSNMAITANKYTVDQSYKKKY